MSPWGGSGNELCISKDEASSLCLPQKRSHITATDTGEAPLG